MQTIVVAMGGNALARQGEDGTYQEQRAHAGQLASVVRSLLDGGRRVLVTHGNGPQVGNLAIQQEEGRRLVSPQVITQSHWRSSRHPPSGCSSRPGSWSSRRAAAASR